MVNDRVSSLIFTLRDKSISKLSDVMELRDFSDVMDLYVALTTFIASDFFKDNILPDLEKSYGYPNIRYQKYKRFTWKEYGFVKSVAILIKAFAILTNGDVNKMCGITESDLKKYVPKCICKRFGSFYNMICLISCKKWKLHEMKSYKLQNQRIDKLLNLPNRTELSLTELEFMGFGDMLKNYICKNYRDLFDTFGIDHRSRIILKNTIYVKLTDFTPSEVLNEYIQMLSNVIDKDRKMCNHMTLVIEYNEGFFSNRAIKKELEKVNLNYRTMAIINRAELTEGITYYDTINVDVDLLKTNLGKLHYMVTSNLLEA